MSQESSNKGHNASLLCFCFTIRGEKNDILNLSPRGQLAIKLEDNIGIAVDDWLFSPFGYFCFTTPFPSIRNVESEESLVTIKGQNGYFQSGKLTTIQSTSPYSSNFTLRFPERSGECGDYEIMIPKGAVANEEWFDNHERGLVNPATTIKFSIVESGQSSISHIPDAEEALSEPKVYGIDGVVAGGNHHGRRRIVIRADGRKELR